MEPYFKREMKILHTADKMRIPNVFQTKRKKNRLVVWMAQAICVPLRVMRRIPL